MALAGLGLNPAGAQVDADPAAATRAVAPATPRVTWVHVEGQLDSGTLSLLRRAIDDARGPGGHLVIELDSPGGEVTLMWRIASAVDEASAEGIETTAWIHDHAVSAAALVALSCDRIYMRSQASIGSATPVQIGPAGLVEMGDHEREKMNSALRADFRAVAQAHGRSGVLAEAMVDKDVEAKWVRVDGELRVMTDVEFDEAQRSGAEVQLERTVSPRGELLNLTGREATELALVDGLAEDREELLDKIGFGGAPLTFVERTRSEDAAAFLQSVAGLLLMAALILGYMELKAPGFGVPGILALVCLGLFVFGRYLVGLADIPHIVLIALGVVLVTIELLLLPGFLWTGLIGGLCLLSGLILAWLGDGLDLSYAMDRQMALDGGYHFTWLAIVAAVAGWAFARFLPHTPVLRGLILRPDGPALSGAAAKPALGGSSASGPQPGERGRALTALRPVGKVALDAHPGREFEASAEGSAVEAACAVRVVAVRSGRLVVAEEPAEASTEVGA